MHCNLPGYQVVLWPRAWRVFRRGQWPEGAYPVYRWIVRVGPIELRRWA